MKYINDLGFESAVLKNARPVLVDFYADWCGPCKMLSPIIEELASEFEGKADIFKMNVDDNPTIAAAMGISSIPALIFFKDGKEIKRIIGMRSKADIAKLLSDILG